MNETKIVYTDKLSELAKKFKQKVVYIAILSDFTAQLQVCAKMLPKKALNKAKKLDEDEIDEIEL